MSGVTLSDLSKYHQGAMKWFKDGLVSEQNRLFAQTEEAGAVSFWPLGGTPLEGKVKFSFKETLPASGDKGPENPSTIAGVSSVSVTRCGKNLLRTPYYYSSYNSNAGGTFTVNADGTVKIHGTFSSGNGWFSVLDTTPYEINPTSKLRLVRGNPYTASLRRISGALTENSMAFQVMKQLVGYTSLTKQVQLNPGDDFVYSSINWNSQYSDERNLKARLGVWKNAVADNLVVAPQLEYGNQATEYEPYIGDDYTIQLGNTYYGGEIDLATGVMTVTWGATVINGTESFSKSANSGDTRSIFSGTFDIPQQTMCRGQSEETRVCSHFPFDRNFNMNTMMTWETATNIFFTVPASEYPTKESFAEWLASEYSAGHPVTVGYKLHNPFTVQLTPLQLTALAQKDKYTPRMNTVYTDADSIQIRYRKSLIHDEDEKVQAIVALGGNV